MKVLECSKKSNQNHLLTLNTILRHTVFGGAL